MSLVLHVSKPGKREGAVIVGAPDASAVVESASLNSSTFTQVLTFSATQADRLRRCFGGYTDFDVELAFISPGETAAAVAPVYLIPPSGGLMTYGGLLDNENTEVWARLVV